MGNYNKARRDVIIFCLPNRSEPKTTASATGEKKKIYPQRSAKRKGITPQNWNHQWPSAGLDGGVAIGSPDVIRARHQSCMKTWKCSQFLRLWKYGSGTKNRTTKQSIIFFFFQPSNFIGSLKQKNISDWSGNTPMSWMPIVLKEQEMTWIYAIWRRFVFWKKVSDASPTPSGRQSETSAKMYFLET